MIMVVAMLMVKANMVIRGETPGGMGSEAPTPMMTK